MPRQFTCIKLSNIFALGLTLAAGVATLTLSGCGIGKADTSQPLMVAPAFSGYLYGGANPLVNATMKVYSTGTTPGDGTSTNTNYGVGTLLQEANQQGTSSGQDTTSTGKFTFAGGYDCPAGQFVYLVATGGSTGANAANPNSVLVAALGRCEDLFGLSGGVYTGYSGGTLYINELTTIAAAYALGHFSSETGSGAGTAVLIGAPATNNAAQVSGVSKGCVAGVGTCTTTAAAGLAHAFLNATNLVNPFNGLAANATLTGNTAALPPQTVVNDLGNVLLSCVNSTGAAANPGGACAQIFAATTPAGGTAPQDTFGAMVNLAANPTLGGSPTAVQNFHNIPSGLGAVTYQPAVTVTSTLNDYSLAIVYPNTSAEVLSYVQSGALDINDVYYVGNVTTSGSAGLNVLAFSSNGTLLGTSASNGTLKNAFTMAIDKNGYGYFGNGGGSSSNIGGAFNTGGGTIAGNTITTLTSSTNNGGNVFNLYALAVDKANNVWAVGAATNTLIKATGGTTSPTFTSVAAPSITVPSSKFVGLGIDPQQNVWIGASTAMYIAPNRGSVGTPSYNTTLLSYTPAGNPLSGFAFAGTASSYTAYATSYGQTVGTEGVNPYTITYTNGQPTITSVSTTGVSDPNEGANPAIIGSGMGEADGTGTVWLADTNSKSIIQYTPGTTPIAGRLLPCQSTGGSCTSAFGSGKPNSLSIDSAGSIWASVPVNGGGTLVEIIGSAAPTWPLLSLGLPAQP